METEISQGIFKRPVRGYHVHWTSMVPPFTPHLSRYDLLAGRNSIQSRGRRSSTVLLPLHTEFVDDDALSAPTFFSSSPIVRGFFSQLEACSRLLSLIDPASTQNIRFFHYSQTVRNLFIKMKIVKIFALIVTLVGPSQVIAQREHVWSSFSAVETPTFGILFDGP